MLAALLLALSAATAPAPSSAPCSRDATASNPVTPDYPEGLHVDGIKRAVIRVRIAPDGLPSSVEVAQSSGVAALDRAAMTAARQSTYLPKIVNCKPVAGSYLFMVTFDPGPNMRTAPNSAASPEPCNHPATARSIAAPVYPRGHWQNKPVVVAVRINIAADGTIDGGGVAQSSGDAAFDAAAIQAAESSRFAPKVVDCHPVAGTYLFKVTFMPH